MSDVNITVNKEATSAEIKGVISGSPAFEANFAVDSELRGACFPAQNVPIQDASRSGAVFIKRLVLDKNKVDTKVELK